MGGNRPTAHPELEIRLLSAVEVAPDGKVLELGGAKPRALLVDLALHPSPDAE